MLHHVLCGHSPKAVNDHLVDAEHEGKGHGIHHEVHDAGCFHQKSEACAGHDEPQEDLGDQDAHEIQYLPLSWHSSDLELHQVEFTPTMDCLGVLLVCPLRRFVSYPVRLLGRDQEQQVTQLYGGSQVIDHGHHEEEATDHSAVPILHAILPGIYLLVDLLGLLREDQLEGVAHEAPGVPDAVGVQPRPGDLRAARPPALRAPRAVLYRGPEVAEVHLPGVGVHDERLLVDDADQKHLEQEIDYQKGVDPNSQPQQGFWPARTSRDLGHGHGSAINRALLHATVALLLHLHQDADGLASSHSGILAGVQLHLVNCTHGPRPREGGHPVRPLGIGPLELVGLRPCPRLHPGVGEVVHLLPPRGR
mmetsp:Transcript_1456/g.4953  ORF Transcript_1456/g.4953 Transcript_1456/m.4953 type:complete len:363 (+) Transcript_1456:543-1631(+)